jgi:spore germination protein YaaH
MEQRTSAAPRVFAALALVVALLAVVVLATSVMDGSDPDGRHRRQHQVQTGDTLTAISHRVGVPVAEILALNPEVDPQILIAGQTLKLR